MSADELLSLMALETQHTCKDVESAHGVFSVSKVVGHRAAGGTWGESLLRPHPERGWLWMPLLAALNVRRIYIVLNLVMHHNWHQCCVWKITTSLLSLDIDVHTSKDCIAPNLLFSESASVRLSYEDQTSHALLQIRSGLHCPADA